jgi:hypothetical protein
MLVEFTDLFARIVGFGSWPGVCMRSLHAGVNY